MNKCVNSQRISNTCVFAVLPSPAIARLGADSISALVSAFRSPGATADE